MPCSPTARSRAVRPSSTRSPSAVAWSPPTCRSFREMLANDPKAGERCRLNDATDLARAIEAYFQVPGEHRQTAARRIADRYDWDNVIQPVTDWLSGPSPKRPLPRRRCPVREERSQPSGIVSGVKNDRLPCPNQTPTHPCRLLGGPPSRHELGRSSSGGPAPADVPVPPRRPVLPHERTCRGPTCLATVCRSAPRAGCARAHAQDGRVRPVLVSSQHKQTLV